MPKDSLAIKTKVVPPPSRRELIEAMAQIQLRQNVAHNEAIKKEREELDKRLVDKLWELARRMEVPVFSRRYEGELELTISLSKSCPDSIKKIGARIQGELKQRRCVDMKEIRQMIRTKMEGATEPTQRISKLVKENEPELLAMLSHLFPKTKAIA